MVGIVGTFEQMAYRKVGCRTFTPECVTSAPSPLQRCEFGATVALVTNNYVLMFQVVTKLESWLAQLGRVINNWLISCKRVLSLGTRAPLANGKGMAVDPKSFSLSLGDSK